MKKYIPLLFLSFLFISCEKNFSFVSFEAMNTFMTLKAYGGNSKGANVLAQNRVRKLEKILSTTNSNSEVYQINHNNWEETPILQITGVTTKLLYTELFFAKETGGLLNPCLYPVTSAWGFTTKQYKVPSDTEIQELLKLTDYNQLKVESNTISLKNGMMIDLGAVAKGYAGDEIIQIYKDNGVKSALIDLGGNIQVLGTKSDGSDWNIGLKNPFGGNPIIGLRVHDCAIVTSGGYERYFTADDGNDYIHIFDGKTGRPVRNNLVSTTIISESGLYADALSTTTFVAGVEGAIELYKNNSHFEMILITENHELYYTEGLENQLTVLEPMNKIEVIKR